MLEESWKLFNNVICCSTQIPASLGAEAFSEKVLVIVCGRDLCFVYIAEVRAWRFMQIETLTPSVGEDMTPCDHVVFWVGRQLLSVFTMLERIIYCFNFSAYTVRFTTTTVSSSF